MRRPNLRLQHVAAVGTVAAAMVLAPMTGAMAQFDDGDYDLSTDCGVDATLRVRGNGNGISVQGGDTMFVHTERADGEVAAALVVDLGSEAADDNTVVTVTSADDEGLACEVETGVSDEEVALLIGLEDDEELSDELEAEESDEPEDDESDEDAVKVELCHGAEGINPHMIEVSEEAVEAHLDHGDLEGECPEGLGEANREARDAEREAARAERDEARAERLADKPGKAGEDHGKGDDVDED